MSDLVDQVLSDPAVGLIAGSFGLALAALWLVATWWVYRDAVRRTDSPFVPYLAAAWLIISTPLLLPLSLGTYLLARPQTTASDARTRDLVRELLVAGHEDPRCPACERRVDAAWRRCPACWTWLATECARCGEWSATDLEACPYCGAESAGPAVAEAPARGFGAALPRPRVLLRR